MQSPATAPPAPPPPVAVEVDVQLQPVDLFRAERTIVWRQVRWFLAISVLLILPLGFVGGGLFLLAGLAVICVFLFAVHSAFLYLASRSTLRTNRVLCGLMHYSFEPGALRIRGATFWAVQDWGSLYEVLETGQTLILRWSSAQKYVIPKRCFAPGDGEKARTIVREGKRANRAGQVPHAPAGSPRLVARVWLTPEDLYRGFFTVLVRKAYWSAAQLVFAFAFIFMVNPQFRSLRAFFVVGSAFFLYLGIHFYRASARAIRTNAAYRDEIEYRFDHSGLEGSGPSFAFRHDWGNFQSILEDSKMFLLCPSNSQMLVIPKRCFAGEAQIEMLRELLRKCYPGKLSLNSISII